jgi:hypothetical protein
MEHKTPKSSVDIEDGEVIGTIMLEDVFEEVLHVNSMCILGTLPRSSLASINIPLVLLSLMLSHFHFLYNAQLRAN